MKHVMLAAFLCILMQSAVVAGADDPAKIPVIYCTDLFHPHDDPDDHFDLACMFAIPEFDIKAIILDQGRRQEEKPGRIPIEQLNRLTGRNVPYAIGLADELDSPGDTGEQQPAAWQAGVETIISVLRASQRPVTIITVGSLRDVAAAYNREPDLFAEKLSRLYVFIGEAQASFREYNVGLDVNAYRCIMNAPLPIYWAPCFDGGIWVNEGNASFWQAKHSDLLADVSNPVLNFFIYAMLHKDTEAPEAALHDAPVPDEKQRVLSDVRNLWCAAVFPYMAERIYVQRGPVYLAVPGAAVQSEDIVVEPFTFLPVNVRVDDSGQESYEEVAAADVVHRFHVNDMAAYANVMTSVTRELLNDLSGMAASKERVFLTETD